MPASGKSPAGVRSSYPKARVAVVRARWNDDITKALENAALEAARVANASVERYEVAGSFELAPAVAVLARTGRFDAIVPLGCLIRGETPHFDVLAHAIARALAELATTMPVAIPFGVLTCDNVAQARARAGGAEGNKGAEWMDAALELAALRHAIAASSLRATRSAATARSGSTRTKRKASPGRR